MRVTVSAVFEVSGGIVGHLPMGTVAATNGEILVLSARPLVDCVLERAHVVRGRPLSVAVNGKYVSLPAWVALGSEVKLEIRVQAYEPN